MGLARVAGKLELRVLLLVRSAARFTGCSLRGGLTGAATGGGHGSWRGGTKCCSAPHLSQETLTSMLRK